MAAPVSLDQFCQEAAEFATRDDGLHTPVRLHNGKGALPTLVDTAVSESSWSFQLVVDSKAMARLKALGVGHDECPHALRTLILAVCRAELGHWRYCPYDSRWLAVIVDGVAAGVAKAAAPGGLGMPVRRLTGLFCDLVAWTCTAAWDRKLDRDSFAEALALRSLATAASPPVPLDLAVMLCLQQWTVAGHCRSRVQAQARHALAGSVQGQWGVLRRAARQVAAGLGLLPQRRIARGAEAARLMSDRSTWRVRAAAFAEAMSRLPASETAPASADVTRMFAGTPTSSERAPRKTGRSRTDAGATLPEDLMSLVYRARGDEIAWAFEDTHDTGVAAAKVAWPGVRRYREGERVSLSDLKLSATRLLPIAGRPPDLWLYRREQPLTVATPGRGLVPRDLAWIVDSSESMRWSPLAVDDGGKFDRLLRTVFGVWRWLERRGLADAMRHAAVNFSTRTFCSGWQAWRDRHVVERVLFHHQNGKTVLDCEVTLRSLLAASRPCVALFVTDGELSRRDDVRDAFQVLRATGHEPVLIDVAPTASSLYSLLRDGGFECHHAADGQALSSIVLGDLLPRRLAG